MKYKRPHKDDKKLQIMADELGYDTINQMLDANYLSSTMPSICWNDDCEAIYDYEPDQNQGYCENCNTQSVRSMLVIEGIM